MLQRVLLPQLGQTMEEGTIEKWHKQEGDRVQRGEVLYELTTDKATLEVEAYAEGVLKKILVEEGRTVPVNELIAIVGAEEDELPEDLSALAAGPSAEGEIATARRQAGAVGGGEAEAAEPAAEPMTPGRVPASPRARRIARERRVPLAALRGSGPGGRIIERDVRAYLAELEGIAYTPAAASYACEEGVSLVDVARSAGGRRVRKEDVQRAVESGSRGARMAAGAPAGQRVALSPMRRTIAERMTAAKQAVPHFYLVGAIRMRAATEFLQDFRALTEERVTVTGLLVKAVGLALKQHPRMNARFDGDAVVLNAACNVGVAVAVEDGLFVPVIKDADAKGLVELSSELRSLAETARAGKLIPEQYQGGSITVSNLGQYGVEYFLPIVNPPETCIVGVGAIVEQPVAEGGELRVEPIMKVSLSADHRVTNGAEAAEFLQTLRDLLEEPSKLGA